VISFLNSIFKYLYCPYISLWQV